jgi:hypothetical protein
MLWERTKYDLVYADIAWPQNYAFVALYVGEFWPLFARPD